MRRCSRLASGIPAAVIDRAGTRFGMPMGPIELADVVGLDVSLHVGPGARRGVQRQRAGHPGQAGGAEEARAARAARDFTSGGTARRCASPTQDLAVPADLEDRLILPMLNEAVAALRERVVEDADLLDAGAIFATGFAPFRGGPLQYAKIAGHRASRRAARPNWRRAMASASVRMPGWSQLGGEDRSQCDSLGRASTVTYDSILRQNHRVEPDGADEFYDG